MRKMPQIRSWVQNGTTGTSTQNQKMQTRWFQASSTFPRGVRMLRLMDSPYQPFGRTLSAGASKLSSVQAEEVSTQKTSASAAQQEVRQQQKDALAVALAKINKQFGKGTVSQLGTQAAYDTSRVISTGTLALDDALGVGGLPLGRIIEIFGPEASGKTCERQCI